MKQKKARKQKRDGEVQKEKKEKGKPTNGEKEV